MAVYVYGTHGVRPEWQGTNQPIALLQVTRQWGGTPPGRSVVTPYLVVGMLALQLFCFMEMTRLHLLELGTGECLGYHSRIVSGNPSSCTLQASEVMGPEKIPRQAPKGLAELRPCADQGQVIW